jgi:hypothetical protein
MTDMLGLAMLHEETTRRAERPRDDQWYYDAFGPPVRSPGVFRRLLAALLQWSGLLGDGEAADGDGVPGGLGLPTAPAACPRRCRPTSLGSRKQAA